MKTYYKITFYLLLFLSINFPFHSLAGTIIPGGMVLAGDNHWTKEGSPYTASAENWFYIGENSNLVIDPGVEVLFKQGQGFYARGFLEIKGTKNEKVIFKSENSTDKWEGLAISSDQNSFVDGVRIENAKNGIIIERSATSSLSDVDVIGNNDEIGINTITSDVTISSSTVTGFKKGFQIEKGITHIETSSIYGNNFGVIYKNAPVYQGKKANNFFLSFFLPQVANAQDVTRSHTIHNSSLFNNTSLNMWNYSWNEEVDARFNYWGTDAGPLNTIIGTIGDIVFSPWIKKNNIDECCSNVVFIPGFEGTRLNKGSNQLWEPNRNADVDKLHLDKEGQSEDPLVTVGEIIKKTNITGGAFDSIIYGSFLDTLDTLVTKGTIKNWVAFPYDWRLDLPLGNLVQTLEAAASSSKTGKVSIVAHSNGGLMAKKVMNELKKIGKEDLVDKLVLVAVPQIGAASAIGALLSGEEQQLGHGVILNKATAKSFGQNLIGAYNLLPSTAYFGKALFSPLRVYGNVVSTFRGLWDFVTSSSSPSLLRDKMLASANTNHDVLDSWVAPSSTQVFQVAGNSLPTTRDIEYYKNNTYKINQKNEGDGTVSIQSSLYMDALSYLFDIKKYEKDQRGDFSHAFIFDANPIHQLIKNILMNSSDVPPYISTSTPQISSTFELREYSVHSPVSIGVYDSKNNHTGLIKNPNPNSDLEIVENMIPGSVYHEFGESKSIGIADDIPVKVVMNGLGVGTFTFEIRDQYKDDSSKSLIYADIPVVDQTVATIDTASTTASTTLMIDADGDGKVDLKIGPNVLLTTLQKLELIKLHIKTYGLGKILQKELEQKIDKLIELYRKNKDKKVENRIKKFITFLDNHKFKTKKLSAEDKAALLDELKDLLILQP